MAMSQYFAECLQSASSGTFDSKKLKQEFRNLKIKHQNCYPNARAKTFWPKVLKFRRDEFPNMCLLAEVVLTLGVSNSIVEGGFSILTAMLSDRRLSLRHDTMENMLMIKGNHRAWSPNDLEQIIDSALDSFMSKRRKCKMAETGKGVFGLAGQPDTQEESDDVTLLSDTDMESDFDIVEDQDSDVASEFSDAD